LCWGGLVALALIVASVLFKIPLGQWFSIAMVGYAGSAILYSTSRILHEYEPNHYVAAGLELFSSIALLFWYVIQLLWEHD
jgi:FtsH-binding integral membrane protein